MDRRLENLVIALGLLFIHVELGLSSHLLAERSGLDCFISTFKSSKLVCLLQVRKLFIPETFKESVGLKLLAVVLPWFHLGLLKNSLALSSGRNPVNLEEGRHITDHPNQHTGQ